MRNQFEHFDEYLDGFLLDVYEGAIPSVRIDMNVAPPETINVAEFEGSTLRNYDNQNHVISMLNVSVSLQSLTIEVERLVGLAQA